MLPTGSGKSLSGYASLPYVFDSLRRAAGEKEAHHSIAIVVCTNTVQWIAAVY